MNRNELEILKKLHEYVFKTVCNFNNLETNFETSPYGGLIVFLKKLDHDSYDIEWNFIRKIIENMNLTIYDYLKRNNNSDQISNQIVHINNLDTNKRPYIIKSICNDMTPLTPFPKEKYKDYKEYHEKIKKLETTNDDQPLVELKQIDSNLNLIQTNIKKFKGSSKLRLIFMAEHIKLLGFNQSMYNYIRLIPSTLFRINCLLKATKLKNIIESDAHFIELGDKIKQPKFEELSWNKSVKFHKIKEDENEKQQKKQKPEELFEEYDNFEIPNEIEEKLNEMIIEVCSKAHRESYESSVDLTSSLTDEMIAFDDEEFLQNIDDDEIMSDLADQFSSLDTEMEESIDPVPKFLIIENRVTNYEIPSNKDNDDAHEFPNVYELLQCLTLKSSNDTFDLERYEILGDCFLKLNTSLYMYCHFKGINEGNMTFLKSQRVSNRYLFKLAEKNHLSDYVIGDGFRVHENWLPPNFITKTLVEGVDDASSTSENLSKFYKIQSISDKSLADCIEALLGVYLIKCGTGAARAFLTWLNFVISKDIEIDFTKRLDLPNPLLTEIGLDKNQINLRLAPFERNIGYTFNNIIYLFQAFTHPSYMSNRFTGSYQRLEFIGDAVLDLLVTQYLFNDEKEHSPGELTDLRQALVNNKFFAHLSTKHNFHKYLSYESKTMFGELDAYIKMQKKYTPKNAYFSSHVVFIQFIFIHVL